MAQYDFHEAPGGRGFWLDCQTDLMDDFNTRILVPLLPVDAAPKPTHQLNPVFQIGDEHFVMVTQYASSVPVSELGQPAGSLANHHYEIVKAFDFLITGV